MNRDILIGVDAGTSVIKAVAFDLSGRQLAMASRRNTYKTLANGGVEQDMRLTWDNAAASLRDLCGMVEDLPRRTLAMAVTGQGDGTWLIDSAGEPLHDAWLWLDARSGREVQDIWASDGHQTIYEQTGSGVTVCQMRTHIAWMRRHAPELVSRAATAFHCKDWLYFKLTGVRAEDPNEAVFTYGDFRTRAYDDDVFDALGQADLKHLFPPIVDGAKDAHTLSADAASATGLPEGLPVILGYIDVMCCAMGAGLYDKAQRPGLSILGSTGAHLRFADNANDIVLNPARSGYVMLFPGEACAQLQLNMACTLNIDWILGVATEVLRAEGVERSSDDLLKGLDDRVAAARPGAALYHPYISQAGERGPFVNSDARAMFSGLDQSTGWFDMVRAVFDGLALAARDCYGAMGPVPSEIRLAGGAARSTTMRTLLASVLDRPVRTVSREEAGAAGAVMIAAVQQGLYSDIGSCAEDWVNPLLGPPTLPEAGLVKTYGALYEGYVATREAAPEIWSAQNAMRNATT